MRLRYISGYVEDVEIRGKEAYRIDERKINLSGDALTLFALSYQREFGKGIKTATAIEYLQNSPAERYEGDEMIVSAALRWEF
jgi:hypothetical protein